MPDQSFSRALMALIDSSLGYVWFVGMAIWGGTAAYMGRIKRTGMPFSIVELIGEWAISGFSGIVTAYVCHSYGFDFYITAALSGVSGHMGGRAIFLVELYGRRWVESRLGIRTRFDDE